MTITNGTTLKATGIGNVKVLCDGKIVTMLKTLHVPHLGRRLVSISKLTQKGLRVKFGDISCKILHADKVVLTAPRESNIYKMKTINEESDFFIEHNDEQSQWELCHARLGHTPIENFKLTATATDGLPKMTNKQDGLCSGCLKGKQAVTKFPASVNHVKTQRVLQLVYASLMRLMKTTSNGSARYILLFVGDFSRYVTAYYL